MGECFAHGRYFGDGTCPACAELVRKGVITGRTHRGAVPYRYTGKGLCRWCGTKVKPPRRSWCSDACVEDFRVRSWPATARAATARRDRGVCAMCGIDTEALEHRVRLMYKHAMAVWANVSRPPPIFPPPRRKSDPPPSEPEPMSPEHLRAHREGVRLAAVWIIRAAGLELRRRGFDVPLLGADQPFTRVHDMIRGRKSDHSKGGHLWEMDHIVPVVDGGGACGLENLRTLCLPCHNKESARLAAYLAKRRAEDAAAERERIAPRLPYID